MIGNLVRIVGKVVRGADWMSMATVVQLRSVVRGRSRCIPKQDGTAVVTGSPALDLSIFYFYTMLRVQHFSIASLYHGEFRLVDHAPSRRNGSQTQSCHC